MKSFPKFKKLQNDKDLDYFAVTYEKCSGLAVPASYLKNNKVYGIYIKSKMIGGFILCSGEDLRTIEFFAAKDKHESLFQKMSPKNTYTEICCFWIDRAFRKKTGINYFIWVSMAYALKRYGTENIIFGTNSRRLAALYSTTPRSIFLHSDLIKNKKTFIFTARKRGCVRGILQIVYHKFLRFLKLEAKRKLPSFMTLNH